jgi:hypothetical protein
LCVEEGCFEFHDRDSSQGAPSGEIPISPMLSAKDANNDGVLDLNTLRNEGDHQH